MPDATALATLRVPFPPNLISKLPKETKAQIDERKANKSAMVFNCPVCSGHHHKNAVHLDYVGHAALTDRLLDVDPEWSWEPMGTTPEGLPAINGGLWIKLTVCGVSRYGFGAADGKQGGDAIKEMIGDALRNAAMRFGAALELWHKGDLHVDEEPAPALKAVEPKQAPDIEPEEGWGAWSLGLIQHLGEVESEAAIEAARNDETNKKRINALRTLDPSQYQAIGKAFQDARARLAKPARQKEAA